MKMKTRKEYVVPKSEPVELKIYGMLCWSGEDQEPAGSD